MEPKPTVTFTKSTDSELLVLTIEAPFESSVEGWERMVTPWWLLCWWRLRNAWDALRGREPLY